ncbi:MAG: hypothetical protein O9302_03205 [Cyclobacteriaceae bacterium]|jgi:hypothetical protein|nr:hypothetical protein [Cytophagales bacterium]MCZ8327044.1 hypothetical protein [Cyclobacteriaceae bacterium]
MAVALNNDFQGTTKVESEITTFHTNILDFADKLSKYLPTLLFWIIGLVLLFTLGLVYTIVMTTIMFSLRIAVKRKLNEALKEIDGLDEPKAIENHLKIERTIKLIDDSLVSSKNFFMFLILNREFEKLANDLRVIERALFAKAYPNYHQELSPEQQEELRTLMQSWREDEIANNEVY